MNNSNLLFIADGSIVNPILHSQGLPLLDYYINKGINCNVLSFEITHKNNSIFESVRKIKERYSKKIKYHEVRYSTSKLIPNWIKFFYYGVITSRKIIQLENIQVIHARSLMPSIIALILKKVFFYKVKFIYDNRGVFIEEEIYKGHWKNNSLKVALFKVLEKLVLKHSDAVVVVSNKFRDYLFSNEFISPKDKVKIFVIPNRTTNPYDEVETVPIENKKGTIITGVYSGSSAKWQNVNGVIEFIKASESSDYQIRFNILTYNPEVFNKLIERNEISSNNVSIENVEPNEVSVKLRNANFGVMIRENNLINNVASPLKFAEYLNAGLPVVISKGIGDTEEIIKKYNIGVILEDDNYSKAVDEIVNLLEDENIHTRCREAAKKEFDITTSFEDYNKIMESFSKV